MIEAFLIKPFLALILITISCSLLGIFVLWKKLSYFGDALSHSILLGLVFGVIFEINQIGRLVSYLKEVDSPHSGAMANSILQSDFKNFYEQYDQRRGKDFKYTKQRWIFEDTPQGLCEIKMRTEHLGCLSIVRKIDKLKNACDEINRLLTRFY